MGAASGSAAQRETPSHRRKLVAIVYADMAGYSRLISHDDQGTLDRLRGLRRELIDPAIEEHAGRIVQTGGDSLLVVFDSIDGAVRCAVKIQAEMPFHDGDRAPDQAIRFRIGINIGDAIADGTDLHGDAVNVAARLQTECLPGGICVSRSVRDHVHGRLDLTFGELGVLKLKNVARRPVEAFAVVLKMIRQAELDIGFIGTDEIPDDLDAIPCWHDEIVVIAAPGLHVGVQPMEVIGTQKFVMREEGSATRQHIEQYLRSCGLNTTTAMTVSSPEAVKRYVAAGIGWGFVSRHSISTELATAQLEIVKIDGWNCRRTFYAVLRNGYRLSESQASFVELAKALDL